MYQMFAGRNANQLYRRVLQQILLDGEFVAPRGKRTQEIQAITQITHPRQRVLTVPGRGNNPFFNVAENLAIIAGLENQRDWFKQFNKQYIEIAHDQDTDGTYDVESWGFYGTRLRRWPLQTLRHSGPIMEIDQLKAITQKLENDPASRQGVAALWHPVLDNDPGHKDYPCNFAVEFKVRQHEFPLGVIRSHLNMTVINRSNDVHLGLFGVNLNQWSFIQEVMAAVLGVEVGEQVHVSDSLHLYLDDPQKSITERMAHYKEGFDVYDYAKPVPMFLSRQEWGGIDEELEMFFTDWAAHKLGTRAGEAIGWTFLSDAWYFLKAYQDKKGGPSHLRFVGDNAMWVAGMEYLWRVRPDNVNLIAMKEEIAKRFTQPEAREMVGRYIATANILQAA